MKFSTQLFALFTLATAVSALTTSGHATARTRRGLALRQAEPPVIERERCQRQVDDGQGTISPQTCDKSEEGIDGCECRINRTQVRCNRVLSDGQGSNSIEVCQQNEEGVDGCECSETFATEKVIRCSRVLSDGQGSNSIEVCQQNEEGVDGCECSETIDVL